MINLTFGKKADKDINSTPFCFLFLYSIECAKQSKLKAVANFTKSNSKLRHTNCSKTTENVCVCLWRQLEMVWKHRSLVSVATAPSSFLFIKFYHECSSNSIETQKLFFFLSHL